uniref:probable G-protein coupled receptor 139 n=1 Tax=Pristiophorus japonicus TaxID=55135 RepID=UPI00398EC458
MGSLAFLLAQDVFYHCLAVIGVAANFMTIVILSRGSCGLARCTGRYLVSMAAVDLLVIIFCVMLNYLGSLYFPFSILTHYHVCSLNSITNAAVVDCSVWLTVAFTLDRFVAICYQKWKTRYCTVRTATGVITTVCTVSYLRNIPRYFTYEPVDVHGPFPVCRLRKLCTNTPWAVYLCACTVLTPLIPYVCILLLNALTVRHVLVASRVRRAFRGQGGDGKQVDPEMENRRRSIILLFAISGSFIVLWMTRVVVFVIQEMLLDIGPMVMQVGDMLMYLNSCTNTCIYALTQAKFREEMRRAITQPIHLFLKLTKDLKPKENLSTHRFHPEAARRGDWLSAPADLRTADWRKAVAFAWLRAADWPQMTSDFPELFTSAQQQAADWCTSRGGESPADWPQMHGPAWQPAADWLRILKRKMMNKRNIRHHFRCQLDAGTSNKTGRKITVS